MYIAVYHELPKGGARRAINEFSRALGKRNTVDLYIVDEKKPLHEKIFYSKIFYYPFIPKKWSGGNPPVRLYKDTIELYKLFNLTKKIAHAIDQEKYDVVIVSTSKYIEAPFIMRFLKTPFIFYVSDPYYRFIYEPLLQVQKEAGFLRYNYEKLKRFCFKTFDKQNIEKALYCYGPSDFIAKKFTKTYGKKNKSVHYGVDTKFFTPGNGEKNIDIFYIGSKDPVDGVDLLDDALKRIKKKLRVRKLLTDEEWISDDRVLRELYRKSKVLFCPAHNEGLGASLMEAMACGTPVIAVNEAGHRELVVDGKNGYLIPRNAKIAAEKIQFILDNTEKRKSMEQFAHDNMLSNWSWKRRAEKLERVLKELARSKKNQLTR